MFYLDAVMEDAPAPIDGVTKEQVPAANAITSEKKEQQPPTSGGGGKKKKKGKK